MLSGKEKDFPQRMFTHRITPKLQAFIHIAPSEGDVSRFNWRKLAPLKRKFILVSTMWYAVHGYSRGLPVRSTRIQRQPRYQLGRKQLKREAVPEYKYYLLDK